MKFVRKKIHVNEKWNTATLASISDICLIDVA